MTHKIETVDKIPDKRALSKYREIYNAMDSMEVNQILKVYFDSKYEMQIARNAISLNITRNKLKFKLVTSQHAEDTYDYEYALFIEKL
jgi:hypothetical protein